MSLRAAIVDWSASQPPWRRDLLRRVAVRDADDQACLEILDLLLGEHGLAPAALTATPLSMSDLPDDAPVIPAVLHEIGECSNVNAIASRDPLTFEPAHITLIYGPNGVGKSSYTRIIKRVAHSAYEETVLGNVFSSISSPPRAVIELEDANGRRKHIVPLGDEARLLLHSMTVFDDRCADVYVRNEKTIEFTPTPLRIFARAAGAQRRIRELLDERIEMLSARRPSLDVFPSGTKVRRALDGLTATSTLDELSELAALSAEEQEQYAKAKLDLAAVDAGASELQSRQRDRDAETLETLATELEYGARSLSAKVEAHIGDCRRAVREASKAVALARAKNLAEEPAATSGEGWFRMWEAVRSFVEDDCHHPFPPTEPGALCPFCQQELTEGSRGRLQRLDHFVRSTLERELETAHQSLADALAEVTPDPFDRALVSAGLALLKDEQPETASRVETWLARGLARCAAIREDKRTPALPRPPAGAVRDLAAIRKAEAVRHRSLVNPEKLEALRRNLLEGEARTLLSQRVSEIERWHATLQTIAALGRVRKNLDTAYLSHKQTDLSKELVTDALRSAVREELNALGFSHVRVDLTCRTDRGTTVARMRLGNASAPVPDVLSVGEQRACALAFFLAETRTSASAGGLVFDDPSASFDVERVEHIARRIVDLAGRRQQLIVFSCDVVFAWFLQRAAEAKGVGFAVRPLARLGDKVGIVRANQGWPGEPLKARRGRLRAALQKLEAQARKDEIDNYELGAKTFAGEIREAWERAIEEELFRSVVMRFQRDVKALKIREVVVTPELTAEVLEGMAEVSAYHHDPALAKPVPTPSPDELRGFLERLETFCEGLKKKKKDTKHPQVA